MSPRQKFTLLFSRLSLFIIFFWFGILKIIGSSPANPLVKNLFEKTVSFTSFEIFIILFGAYEMLLGVLFLIPRLEKITLILFAIHMITTLLPLFVLKEITWQGLFTPTLEGQYIIKNLALIALVLNLTLQGNKK